MSNNKEILIGVKIQVNNEKAIRKIVESQKQIDELKKKQTELTEALDLSIIQKEREIYTLKYDCQVYENEEDLPF